MLEQFLTYWLVTTYRSINGALVFAIGPHWFWFVYFAGLVAVVVWSVVKEIKRGH